MRGLLALGGLVAALSLPFSTGARDCEGLVLPDSSDATNITVYECDSDEIIDRIELTYRGRRFLVEQDPVNSTSWQGSIEMDPNDPYFSFYVYRKVGKRWKKTDKVMRVYDFQEIWDVAHPQS